MQCQQLEIKTWASDQLKRTQEAVLFYARFTCSSESWEKVWNSFRGLCVLPSRMKQKSVFLVSFLVSDNRRQIALVDDMREGQGKCTQL